MPVEDFKSKDTPEGSKKPAADIQRRLSEERGEASTTANVGEHREREDVASLIRSFGENAQSINNEKAAKYARQEYIDGEIRIKGVDGVNRDINNRKNDFISKNPYQAGKVEEAFKSIVQSYKRELDGLKHPSRGRAHEIDVKYHARMKGILDELEGNQ